MAEIDFRHAELPGPAVKFLATFLRFEFALKEEGLCPREGDATVDWGLVTKKLGPAFYGFVMKSGSAETIMKRPPKKQVLRDHRLDWKEQDPPANVQELFEAVRRVRNNLIHGGKSGDPEYDPNDSQRNKKLIREAQWIVEQALNQLNDVRNYFEGRF